MKNFFAVFRFATGFCVAILVVCSFSGCGTIVNLVQSRGPRVYGGVRLEAAAIGEKGYPFSAVIGGLALPLAVLDMPLSLVGDTVTLPAVLIWQGILKNKQDSRSNCRPLPQASKAPKPADEGEKK